MGRWPPKEEREKRDKKIIELYQSGLPCKAITARFGLSSDWAIYATLKRYRVTARRR